MDDDPDSEIRRKKKGHFHPTALGKNSQRCFDRSGFDDLFNETLHRAHGARAWIEIEEGKLNGPMRCTNL